MKTFLLLISLTILQISQAQTSVWKATKDGYSIYFASDFGKMEKSYYPLPNAYYTAYNMSDILLLEDDAYNYTTAEYLEMNKLPEGKTLKSELDDISYAQINALCEEVDMEIEELEHFDPIFVLHYLKSLRSKDQAFKANRIDTYFRIRSNKAKKETQALLDYAEKPHYYDTLPDSVKLNDFKKAMEEIDEADKNANKYYKDWKNGKTKSVLEYLEALKTEDYDHYKFLVIERSEALFQKLQKYLNNDKTSFALLSRINLLGEDGIFSKLEKEGYNIVQL